MEPSFLRVDEVLALHAEQIRRYGGGGGLRDTRLLAPASSIPQQSFSGQYLHGTICEMAAAYLYHLVMNHPFIEGNKRIGLAAAIAFLGLNSLRLNCGEDEVVDLILQVARGAYSKSKVAVFFERHTSSWH